jgi:hypothetical protein
MNISLLPLGEGPGMRARSVATAGKFANPFLKEIEVTWETRCAFGRLS